MKKFFIIFFILTQLQNLYASEQTLFEEDLITSKQEEVLKLKTNNEKSEKNRISVLASIKVARKAFKQWKKENPNYKEIRAEFKKVSDKIQQKGSLENIALNRVIKECQKRPSDCESMMKSNLESIYTNSEIPTLAIKKPFSIISSAYASGITTNSCMSEDWEGDHAPESMYFAGLFGSNENCGLSFFGPGLGFVSLPNHFLICSGSGKGTNVGVYASANAFFGVGVGLTVGEGGLCQLLSMNFVGIGAFAGIVVSKNFGNETNW